MVVIPVGPGLVGQDLDVGIFFVVAVMGVGVIGTLMGGWSSANKFSLLGGIRVAAQLMSDELPFVLAAASVAMAAGTLSLTGIVAAWNPWWLLWQGIALGVFFVAGLAELQRPPFDMPVADAEIVFGPYTEYGGLRFALFILAEYAGIVVLSALTTVLFPAAGTDVLRHGRVPVDAGQDVRGRLRGDLGGLPTREDAERCDSRHWLGVVVDDAGVHAAP